MKTALSFITLLLLGSCINNDSLQIKGYFLFSNPEGVLYETIPIEAGEFEEKSLIYYNFQSGSNDTIVKNSIFEITVSRLSDSEFLFSCGNLISKYDGMTGSVIKLFENSNSNDKHSIINSIAAYNNMIFYTVWDNDTQITLYKIAKGEARRVFGTIINDLEYPAIKTQINGDLLFLKTQSSLLVMDINDTSSSAVSIKFDVIDFEANDSILVLFDNKGMHLYEIEQVKIDLCQNQEPIASIEFETKYHPLNRIFVCKSRIYYFDSYRNKCYQFNGKQFLLTEFIPVYESNKTNIKFINDHYFKIVTNRIK